jgi:hypothetical protein
MQSQPRQHETRSPEFSLACEQEKLDKLEQEYKANPKREMVGELWKQAGRVARQMEAQGKNSQSVIEMLERAFPNQGHISLYIPAKPVERKTFHQDLDRCTLF